MASSGPVAMIYRVRGCGSGMRAEQFPTLAGHNWGWRSRWRRTAYLGPSVLVSTLETARRAGRGHPVVTISDLFVKSNFIMPELVLQS